VHGLPGTLVDEFYSASAQRPIVRVAPVLETPQRRKTLDETIDARQLLTVTDVCKLLRISKPTLWRIRRAGNFPDPTTVTERIFGWRRSEVDAWLASRQTLRRY
jgi:predicted DNA-binding transcriptional regulator AlpA